MATSSPWLQANRSFRACSSVAGSFLWQLPAPGCKQTDPSEHALQSLGAFYGNFQPLAASKPILQSMLFSRWELSMATSSPWLQANRSFRACSSLAGSFLWQLPAPGCKQTDPSEHALHSLGAFYGNFQPLAASKPILQSMLFTRWELSMA